MTLALGGIVLRIRRSLVLDFAAEVLAVRLLPIDGWGCRPYVIENTTLQSTFGVNKRQQANKYLKSTSTRVSTAQLTKTVYDARFLLKTSLFVVVKGREDTCSPQALSLGSLAVILRSVFSRSASFRCAFRSVASVNSGRQHCTRMISKTTKFIFSCGSRTLIRLRLNLLTVYAHVSESSFGKV